MQNNYYYIKWFWNNETVITFNKDYASSLSEGEHTLKVAFNNGGEATTKFTIAKSSNTANDDTKYEKIVNQNITDEKTNTETKQDTETTTNTTKSDNPKTGDNIAIWISLLVISMIGVAVTVEFVKKNK